MVKLIYNKKVYEIDKERLELYVDISEGGKELQLNLECNVSGLLQMEYNSVDEETFTSTDDIKIENKHLSVTIGDEDKEFPESHVCFKAFFASLLEYIKDNSPFTVTGNLDKERIVDDFMLEDGAQIIKKYI